MDKAVRKVLSDELTSSRKLRKGGSKSGDDLLGSTDVNPDMYRDFSSKHQWLLIFVHIGVAKKAYGDNWKKLTFFLPYFSTVKLASQFMIM